jgi:hypothetical protein
VKTAMNYVGMLFYLKRLEDSKNLEIVDGKKLGVGMRSMLKFQFISKDTVGSLGLTEPAITSHTWNKYTASALTIRLKPHHLELLQYQYGNLFSSHPDATMNGFFSFALHAVQSYAKIYDSGDLANSSLMSSTNNLLPLKQLIHILN